MLALWVWLSVTLKLESGNGAATAAGCAAGLGIYAAYPLHLE